jgi:hypothetical protein
MDDYILDQPTGIGSNSLLSTLIDHVAQHEGAMEAAELEMIFGILASLEGRVSPQIMKQAQERLSALAMAKELDAVDELGAAHAAESCIGDQATTESADTSPQSIMVEPVDMVDEPTVQDLLTGEFAEVETHAPGPVWSVDEVSSDVGTSDEAPAAHDADMLPQSGEPEYHGHDAIEDDSALPDDPLKQAAVCGPARLVALARSTDPSAQLCNLIVARGNPEALAVMAANPAARFAKSSLTTMVELAASDLAIREALCSRADLGDMILDRLWPYLSPAAKSRVIGAGCRQSHEEARILCEAADDEMEALAGAYGDARSVDDWMASIDARDETLSQAMRTLDGEGRIVDVAVMLAQRAGLEPQLALALLLGRYDRGAVALARLAACDDDSLATLIHVRGRAGARSTADKRGPLHAFDRMGEGEAMTIVTHIRLELDRGMERDSPVALSAHIHDEPMAAAA